MVIQMKWIEMTKIFMMIQIEINPFASMVYTSISQRSLGYKIDLYLT